MFVRLYHACCALLLAALAHPRLGRRHLTSSRLRLLLHCKPLIDVDSNTPIQNTTRPTYDVVVDPVHTVQAGFFIVLSAYPITPYHQGWAGGPGALPQATTCLHVNL